MSAERIVVEIETTIDAIGTVETHYYSTSGFSTKPTDTPANTYVAPRLKSAGNFRRELFSGTRVTGSVRPSFGEIVLFNNDAGLDDWLCYGVSGGKVTVRMGDETAAYPAGYTTLYIAYAQHIVADFSEIRIRLRDRLNLLEQPLVTASFAGTGGLEGTTAMAGKLKQWVSSDPCWFPPILVDAAKQLYFVQSTGAGGLTGSFAVYEGGIAITRNSNYPDASTCLSTSPAVGECRFFFDTAAVYVRLGSVPQLDLRVNGFGYHPSGSAWTFGVFAAQAGISGGTGPMTVGAQFIDDSSTYAEVMEDACKVSLGFFGMTRLDSFISGVLAVPSSSPTYTFNQHNAKDWRRSPIQDMDAPVWSLTANVGKTYPGSVALGASATNKEIYQRSPWWSAVAKTDASVKTANPGAVAVVINANGRHFQSALDQTNFTTPYMALFGVRRDFYTCTVPLSAETVGLDLHDTVAIKLPRFGLDAGKNFRVITQQIDCDRREITYGMWG